MRLRLGLIGLAFVVVLLGSMSIHIERPRSPFLAGFTLKNILDPIVPELSKKKGWHSSASEEMRYVRFRPVYDRRYNLFLHISQGAESRFLQELRTVIDQRVKQTQVELRGSNDGDEFFVRRYTDGRSRGVIRVSGTRGEEDTYTVRIEIHEI